MANLQEKNKWETGIYQIEENDPVHGGPDGITNKPIKQLANRTKYLKSEVEKRYIEKTASTKQAGTVQLVDDLTTDDNSKALTARQGLSLKRFIDGLTRSLGNYITNSKKSNAVNSTSSDTVATSFAVKTAYDKAVNALNTANSKQSPATTLAGYNIGDFKIERFRGDLNNLRTDGHYFIGSSSQVENKPNNAGTGNILINGGNNENACHQVYFEHYSNKIYIRQQSDYQENTWSDWVLINPDLSSAIDSTSEDNIATSLAVKKINDKTIEIEKSLPKSERLTGDLDLILKTGVYQQNTFNNVRDEYHYPVVEAGTLWVFEGSVSIEQIYLTSSANGFRRYKTSRGWSAWQEIMPKYEQDLSANGWVKLPNGLLMQWGFVGTKNINQINFNIPFTRRVLNLQLSLRTDKSQWNPIVIRQSELSLNGFSISKNDQEGHGFYWLAIGY